MYDEIQKAVAYFKHSRGKQGNSMWTAGNTPRIELGSSEIQILKLILTLTKSVERVTGLNALHYDFNSIRLLLNTSFETSYTMIKL
jgi:hypothetical protein